MPSVPPSTLAPLPLIKIAAVLFKEISKPIANALKTHAHSAPRFRAFAVALGRAYELGAQRVEALVSRGGGGGARAAPKPVHDAQAFAVGTDLLTQSFLLSTAIGLVVVEYWRAQVLKDAETAEKAAAKAVRRAGKEARLGELERSLADVAARLAVAELAAEDAAAAALVKPATTPRRW